MSENGLALKKQFVSEGNEGRVHAFKLLLLSKHWAVLSSKGVNAKEKQALVLLISIAMV